jgi:hypothetical protein
MTLAIKPCRTERETLESEINATKELLKHLENRLCDECDSDGQIIDETRITSTTIDVPYKTCPVCIGTKVKQ